MKKAYQDILNRLVNSMNKDAPNWVRPWVTDKDNYPNLVETIPNAETVFNDYYKRERIDFIEFEQNKSYYNPAADAIILPLKKQFISQEAYYAVKAHETIHSTGDYTRCYRKIFDEYKSFQFGDSRYSQEELVAEIGACFLLNALGIDTAYVEANAGAYIANWLTHLNNNTKWIYKAGGLAEEAVEYILETAGEEAGK